MEEYNENEKIRIDSEGYFNEYDLKGNHVHHKSINGFEYWREFDELNREVHYKDNNGIEEFYKYEGNKKIISDSTYLFNNNSNTKLIINDNNIIIDEKFINDDKIKLLLTSICTSTMSSINLCNCLLKLDFYKNSEFSLMINMESLKFCIDNMQKLYFTPEVLLSNTTGEILLIYRNDEDYIEFKICEKITEVMSNINCKELDYEIDTDISEINKKIFDFYNIKIVRCIK